MELRVWQKAHRLTLEAYRVTALFPREELRGFTGQIRRSAASIPANIAEGCGGMAIDTIGYRLPAIGLDGGST